MDQKLNGGILALACLLFIPATAHADKLLQDVHVSGDIRVYDFSRDYKLGPDLHAFSIGGKLKGETDSISGFSAAAAFYFAQDIGLNNHDQNNKHINPLLMGVNHEIDALGEAYVQYKNRYLLARVGNQSIDNPWINPSDGFMIPNLYQGITAEVTPINGLSIYADRIMRFKNRTATGFSKSNLFALSYDKPNYAGKDNGAISFGATYKNKGILARAWQYHFYDFAKMNYFEGGYKFPVEYVSPFANLQYVQESSNGAQLLGAVDAKAYGAKLGLNLPNHFGSVYLAFNKVPYNLVAGIPNGNLLSPYTQIYNTDPLYTTIMNYGLVSARVPGEAYLIGMTLAPLEKRLDITSTLSKYNTEPYAVNINAFMLDVAYHPTGKLKGFTIRNRLGIEHGNPAWGNSYIDERVMLQYAF